MVEFLWRSLNDLLRPFHFELYARYDMTKDNRLVGPRWRFRRTL